MPTSHKTKNQNKLHIVAGVVFLLFVALFIVYFAKLYPVAIVNGNFISDKDWVDDYSIAIKLDPSVSKQQVFDQFMVNKQKEALVAKLDIDEDDSFANELVYYKTGNEAQYNKLISDYFSGDERSFESSVVVPETVDALLRIKYNSNFSSNNDAYNKAQNISAKLSQGFLFDDLAKEYSDDKVSAQVGGDIGFISENQILPELKASLTSATLGQVDTNILISRQGYHLLFPVETATKDNQKIWHIKQILIQTTGYDNWLNAQLQTIVVHRLMNI